MEYLNMGGCYMMRGVIDRNCEPRRKDARRVKDARSGVEGVQDIVDRTAVLWDGKTCQPHVAVSDFGADYRYLTRRKRTSKETCLAVTSSWMGCTLVLPIACLHFGTRLRRAGRFVGAQECNDERCEIDGKTSARGVPD